MSGLIETVSTTRVRSMPPIWRGFYIQAEHAMRDIGVTGVQTCALPIKMVRMTVSDEGEGISAEHNPRLTESFYRVDASRSRSLGGTGLGLSIVKHIVERHRGRLNIKDRKSGV